MTQSILKTSGDPGDRACRRLNRRSLLLRALKWGAILALLLLMLLASGAWLAYSKRTGILNSILEEAAAPYRIMAGEFDIDAGGNIELYDIRLEPGDAKGAVITIPHASGVIDFRQALNGRFVSVTLKRPVIRVPLEALVGGSDAPLGLEAIDRDVSRMAPAIASPRFALETLSIDDAELRVGDVLEARFDYNANTLAVYDDGTVETRRHRLSLRDVRAAQPAAAAAAAGAGAGAAGTPEWLLIPAADAEFSVHRDDGVVRVHTLEIPGAQITANGALRRWLADSGLLPDASPVPTESRPDTSKGAPPAFSSLIVEGTSIGTVDFTIEQWPGLPDASGRLDIDCSGLQLPFAAGQIFDEWRLDTMRLRGHDLSCAVPGTEEGAFARIPSAEVVITRGEDRTIDIRQATTRGAEVTISPEVAGFLAAARTPAAESSAETSGRGAGSPQPAEWKARLRVIAATIEDASVAVAGFDAASEQRPYFLPHLTCGLDAVLRNVTLSDEGVQSASLQELSLTDVRASLRDAPELAAICGAEMALIPDDFMRQGTLARLRVDSPDVQLTEPFWSLVAEMQASGSAAPPAPESPTGATAGGLPKPNEESLPQGWQQVAVEALTLHDGFFRIIQNNPTFPNLEGNLEITTRSGGNAGDAPEYLATAGNLLFSAPADPSLPFARVQSLEVIADHASFWNNRRLTAARIVGAELQAGAQLQSLLQEAGSPGEDSTGPLSGTMATQRAAAALPPSASQSPSNDWHVATLAVEDSLVTVKDLAPLIPDIPLHITTTMADFPLSRNGVHSHDEPLKVEVARIRVPSPYGQSPTPVAEMDAVFIHFTLGGLMQKQIDKVEVLNPTIYVGENLFWYIEFFRNADKAVANADKAVASADKAGAGQTGASPAAAAGEGWDIRQIDAHYGQLIIALDGTVNPDLPAFPFGCSTALKEGTLSATLDIPGGEYRPVQGLDLMVKITGGHAEFNLPLGQESNNLVEVFRVEELRYKQFLSTDVHLSVTYDQYGIYAQFGGETYGGYTNGAFNLYINEAYSWDGWIAGDKVSATELTRALTPEVYLMSGAADFKLIAQGDISSLYQAYGNLAMDAPGIISIPALDGLRGTFPNDWSRLKASLAELGISSLRDLPYESCAADFKIYEREGSLNLKATGSGGTRAFQVAVHDYRLPTPAKILELAHDSADAAGERASR